MIRKATTDEEILATRAVMRELRPAIPADAYVATVRRMMETDGYQLVALYTEDAARAVAGYRFMEKLHCGRIMYVDDLNTDERYRSKGYGKALMDWLKTEAKAQGCEQLQLDSGVQREGAHRFYFREGLTISSYHFRIKL
jgi:GNAT superfamily N-acetyltransferase